MQQRRLSSLNYSSSRSIIRAIIIGLVTGLIVSIFRLCIQSALGGVRLAFTYFHHHPVWLIPWAIGAVILALILGRLTQRNPNIKGSGIPQVEGQLTGQFDEEWWPVLWRKFVGGIASIGSGLFLGREGPSIQLGATVGQGVVEQAHVTAVERRVGIASGAAAGLSAAFNAPIASTMFILEEVYHNFSPLVWLSVFISALSSNLVSMQFFGLTPDLNVPHESVFPLNQYWQLVGLGLLLGLLGRLYQVVILELGDWTRKLTWLKPMAYPVIPFLLVMPIAWLWSNVLGGGNDLILALPQMKGMLVALIGLFILRFVFSMVSYATELPGGIFLPILSLGATIGAIYSVALAQLGWIPIHYLPNYIIYAMAGYFACISKAPFTAILLITEMVGTMAHLMPLAVVAVVAYLVDDVLGGRPIYFAMFEKFIHRQPNEQLRGLTQMTTTIFAGAQLDGMQIKDFAWPKESLVLAVYRGEDQLAPHGDTQLQVGDTLVIQLTGQHHLKEQAQINRAAHVPGKVGPHA